MTDSPGLNSIIDFLRFVSIVLSLTFAYQLLILPVLIYLVKRGLDLEERMLKRLEQIKGKEDDK